MKAALTFEFTFRVTQRIKFCTIALSLFCHQHDWRPSILNPNSNWDRGKYGPSTTSPPTFLRKVWIKSKLTNHDRGPLKHKHTHFDHQRIWNIVGTNMHSLPRPLASSYIINYRKIKRVQRGHIHWAWSTLELEMGLRWFCEHMFIFT